MTPPQAYLQQSITTASPANLVLALYDGVLIAIDRASTCLEEPRVGSLETAHNELVRAQKILHELRVSLDHGRGGNIATSLDLLYGFCLERLVETNIFKDAARLGAVRQVVGEIRDAWEQACCGSPLEAVTA